MIDGTLIIIMEFCEGIILIVCFTKKKHINIKTTSTAFNSFLQLLRGRFSFPHKAEEKQKGKVT